VEPPAIDRGAMPMLSRPSQTIGAMRMVLSRKPHHTMVCRKLIDIDGNILD
jgi:hypothetical protein